MSDKKLEYLDGTRAEISFSELIDHLTAHANTIDINTEKERAANVWALVDSMRRRLDNFYATRLEPKLFHIIEEHGPIPIIEETSLGISWNTTERLVDQDTLVELIFAVGSAKPAAPAAWPPPIAPKVADLGTLELIKKLLRRESKGPFKPSEVGEHLNVRKFFYKKTRTKKVTVKGKRPGPEKEDSELPGRVVARQNAFIRPSSKKGATA